MRGGLPAGQGSAQGAPYAFYPFHLLEAHEAGLVSKNVLCAELYGAGSALGLFWAAPLRNAMLDALFT